MRIKLKPAITATISAILFASSTHSTLADQLDKIKDRGKIIIGIKNDYKPFGFLDSDGKLQGFEIELARYIGTEIAGSEDKIEYVPVVASNRMELLNQGRIDIIVATLGRTEERAKVLDYGDDYYMLGEGSVVAPVDSKLTSWDAIRGVKLCGMLGNSFNRVLTEKYGAELVLFQGTAELFKAFEDNRCEGVGFDEPILQQKVAEPAWQGKYEITIPADSFIPIAIGVRKGETALRDAANRAIEHAAAEGVLTSAAERFNMGKSQFLEDQQAKAKAAR
ncbi:MAG: transporter substrate-binding domain-containing protein [Aquamicrobium sp.]|uniref:transporter substrate-binding domain-containing protein n=1 Tax=Aquamicrobium sp. TaxID=1872579 RepID=UPI00349E97F4|nr:transporter substrate-binding domain-containing protein [Aquamicrobium sp.]